MVKKIAETLKNILGLSRSQSAAETPLPPPPPPKPVTFEELGLHDNILKGVKELGFVKPTPVQEKAIPEIITGKDVIVSAQTGSGKTAAFVLPILQRLMDKPAPRPGMRTLILSPTRELAQQSIEHMQSLSNYVPLRGMAIFGGVSMEPQIAMLKSNVEVISATPGRLLDHVYSGRIDFGAVEVFVLDEADRMMDMGFLPDVQRIISFLPRNRQTLVFSATIPDEILALAKEITKEPVTIQIGQNRRTIAAGIRHAMYPVAEDQKLEMVQKLLKIDGTDSVIIFVRTKQRADRLGRDLQRKRIDAGVIHGDRSQDQRLRTLEAFRRGRCNVLVATDVAARGLDIKDITHVINYDVPLSPEDYIHRIGRTGRAEATGDAFTLVSQEEGHLLREIEKTLNERVPRVILPDFPYRRMPQFDDAQEDRGRGGQDRHRRGGEHRQGGRPEQGRQGHGRPQGHGGRDHGRDRGDRGGRPQGDGRRDHGRRDNRGERHQGQGRPQQSGAYDRPRHEQQDRPRHEQHDRPRHEQRDRPRHQDGEHSRSDRQHSQDRPHSDAAPAHADAQVSRPDSNGNGQASRQPQGQHGQGDGGNRRRRRRGGRGRRHGGSGGGREGGPRPFHYPGDGPTRFRSGGSDEIYTNF
ncbi:MAG: ATP-dependent RNA helicase RhlE [Candidatus Omnitrophica bacterium]|nr:ATP-dependent RNA helicase RhlE [Candidatus Omnitrophota bacterium]